MNPLVLIALFTQSLDVANTCKMLNQPTKYTEGNPLLKGMNCKTGIILKSLSFAPTIIEYKLNGNSRNYKIMLGMAVAAGSVGISISLINKD